MSKRGNVNKSVHRNNPTLVIVNQKDGASDILFSPSLISTPDCARTPAITRILSMGRGSVSIIIAHTEAEEKIN